MAVIAVESLHKRYGERVAVHDVSFAVERGEVFGLVGPNGAGKTTTVESIAGLRRPDGGSVRVLGLDPRRDGRTLRRQVGVQLQHSELPELITVTEALELYRAFYADPADPGALIEDWGLASVRHSAFRTLSGGERQRLSIALALVGNPTVALLDELTTGLDPQARRDTWDLIDRIRDRGVTVLLVSHAMEEVERLCDRIAVIDAGRVVALDTPAGLVARAGSAQRVRFRLSQPWDESALRDLPEVSAVHRHGSRLEVAGTGNLLYAVTVLLARDQVVAEELRVDQTSLDDAFVELTARMRDEER